MSKIFTDLKRFSRAFGAFFNLLLFEQLKTSSQSGRALHSNSPLNSQPENSEFCSSISPIHREENPE